ncbi:MAG: hypothetical protein M0Q42_12250 [Xanthomonadales bacterium]|nr:hypothetical protein [Xanthomonadales bacterium]
MSALIVLAALAGQGHAGTDAPAGTPATILFESTAVPTTEPGGGLSVMPTSFPGHTFRLTERAHVTALGGRLIGIPGRSVFAGLYQVDTPMTSPDVPADSTLLATTLLSTTSHDIQDVSGPVDLVLEPGWYAIVLGLNRHGATAANHNVSLANTGMPVTSQSRGPYSVNPVTGNITTHQARLRLFVSGHWLPPEPVSTRAFMIESARPWAWTSGGTNINASNTYVMRFNLERSTRIDQVDTWLMGSSGTLYGAIFPLAGSWARPPLPTSAGFADQAIASTLIAGQPGYRKASASFDDVLLPPGEYALVLGSGHFGASGSATILRAEDHVLGVQMLLYPGSGPVWFNTDPSAMMRLTGTAPDLVGDQASLQFGPTLVDDQDSRVLTLHNQSPDVELLLGPMQLQGPDAGQFSLAHASACAVLLPGDSCQLTLTYHPDHVAAGAEGHQAQLVVDSNQQAALLVVDLSGSALPSAWITPVAAANGTISPDTAQLVGIGASASFQMQPASNHHLAAVGGTCGGSLDGLVFTTAPVAGDCTVAPVFAIDTWQVETIATGNGTISPAGVITVEHGDTPSFVLAAATGHHISSISSSCIGEWIGNAYILAPVTSDCTIYVFFAIDTFQVSASAGDHGSISPAGMFTVDYGDTPSFVVTPDTGHHLDTLSSDCPGTLAGNVFTLEPVMFHCTLHASFAIDTFQIGASAGDNGAINPTGMLTVDYGDTPSFTVTPDTGHHLDEVSGSCIGTLAGDVFTLEPVTADCALHARFAIDTFQISASAGDDGSIDPDGTITVDYGDTPSFTLTPDTGHHLDEVSGSCIGTLAGYVFTLEPVTADCALHARFAIDTFQVSASVGDHGSIDPDGTITVDYGDMPSFTVTPDTGHHLEEVSGSCSGALDGDVYTLDPVTADCALHARFAIDTFQIIASAGDNGSIDPDGTITVDYGDTPAFSLLPDAGYRVEGVRTNCQGSLADDVYTLDPVSAGCTLHASFTLAPASVLTIVSGSGQSARINTGFAEPLVLAVSNDAGLPVPGVSVSFQGPASGAGAIIPGQASSNEQGQVTVAVSANNVPGSYAIQASVAGIAEPVVFELTNLPPAVTLALDIDNGLEHLAYGSHAAWLVTLRNTGQDPATQGTVLVPLPVQLDLTQAEWFCLDLDSGCRASGTGSLDDDGLALAAGGQVQYLISAPVRIDAAGDEVVVQAYAEAEHHHPVSASARSWLVLFRDGFQILLDSDPVSEQDEE